MVDSPLLHHVHGAGPKICGVKGKIASVAVTFALFVSAAASASGAPCPEAALEEARAVRSLIRDFDVLESVWQRDVSWSMEHGNVPVTSGTVYLLGQGVQGYRPCAPGPVESYDLEGTSGMIGLSWVGPRSQVAVRVFVLGAGDHLRGTTREGEELQEGNTFTEGMNGASVQWRDRVAITYGNFGLQDRHFLRVSSPALAGLHWDLVRDEKKVPLLRAGTSDIPLGGSFSAGINGEQRGRHHLIFEPAAVWDVPRTGAGAQLGPRTVRATAGVRADRLAFESARVEARWNEAFDSSEETRAGLGAFAAASVFRDDTGNVLPGGEVGLDIHFEHSRFTGGLAVLTAANRVALLRDLPGAANRSEETLMIYLRGGF